MKLGYEMKSGDPVDVPVTHSVVSALTGGGKTEAILRLMHEAEAAGYTVLALDVKAKPRDFEGVGREIRPYISESTEPLLVLRMLESVAGAGLFSRFSVILDACMDTRELEDVKANFGTIRDNKKAWARKRDDAKVLSYLLEKLLDQIQEGAYANAIQLTPGKINVMDLTSLPLGVQQLVVDSVFRWLLVRERKVILVLEEAINFIPQMEKVQFETSARKFIREGRSAELWLWASGQALTEMDIHIRKQMRAWILGGQMEENEAAKFMRQVPMKGIKPEEVQRLPTGHFIAAIRRTEEEGGKVEVKHVYVQPTWLPDDAAIKVAKGEWTLKNVMRFKKAKPKKVVRDMDDEERKHLKGEIQKWANIAEGKDTELNSLAKQLEEAQFDIKTLKDELELTKSTRQVIAREVIRENLGKVFPDLPQKVPAIVEGDIDLDTLAAKLIDMATPGIADAVEARILAKIPKGQKIEVPPPRVVLTKLLQDEVDRIKAKISALNVMQKKMLAYVAAKKTTQKYSDVQKAVAGYVSGPYRELLVMIRDTGLMTVDTQHSTVRYAGRELVEQDLRGRYDLTDEDVQAVVAAIENEFAHMLGEIR